MLGSPSHPTETWLSRPTGCQQPLISCFPESCSPQPQRAWPPSLSPAPGHGSGQGWIRSWNSWSFHLGPEGREGSRLQGLKGEQAGAPLYWALLTEALGARRKHSVHPEQENQQSSGLCSPDPSREEGMLRGGARRLIIIIFFFFEEAYLNAFRDSPLSLPKLPQIHQG